ncbi:uncharacterized protein LOC118799583 [Colossoma macropomum]|uniref:uncharacterized protein LOC118799583 n=1 Tax=Colossoma macropomum TaxID=42526 RepID=UPI00186550C6|nr:uncharacterized protein LOC118799583 [Colossoma macropomum]
MNASLRIGVLLIVCLQTVQSQHFTALNAVVNDPVTLLCEIVCLGDAQWTIFIPSKTDIARCDKGTCRVEKGFQKRFAFSGDTKKGNISLLIRSVVYNDVGSYRCSCDGKTSEIKLKVFVPTVVTARKLENVTLPCYGDTRQDANDVQWKRDGQKVLLYNHWTRTVTAGEGFEDRFFLSQEAFPDGDLSLHITSVRHSDAGLYLCSIHDEFREGEPRAVLLKVERGSRQRYLDAIIILVIVLGLVIFLLVIFSNLHKVHTDTPKDTAASLSTSSSPI